MNIDQKIIIHTTRIGIGYLIFLLIVCACSSVNYPAKKKDKFTSIVKGVGYNNFTVGESNVNDVISELGNDFEEIPHGLYSMELNYKKRGVSFYYCQKDTTRTIFTIALVPPFKGKIEGIRLGKSKMKEVIKTFGEANWTTSLESLNWTNNYEGINFSVAKDTTLPQFPLNEEIHIKKRIIEIEVTNECQCNIEF